MNTRVTECLLKLNLPFKSQHFVAGRVVDFALPDKMLLEVDGIFHYEARTLRTNDWTNFRNLHLVLSGYKLMTISIYEYNIYR
jgi:very-short-patch-repair endonuclease